MIELFKSIGLKSDPFTTSPNVEKFYPATEHRQCLEGLELSVRLRRGLSVIRGGIGVGKTTVSRKLIEIFSDESNTYEFHLIHDPKFETELIFSELRKKEMMYKVVETLSKITCLKLALKMVK